MREALAEAPTADAPAADAPAADAPAADATMLAAALDRLQRVLASSGVRSSALDLLAADALLTDAVAVAAEREPAALVEFAEEALRRIAALLPETGAAPEEP
jgi:hypothetical protein